MKRLTIFLSAVMLLSLLTGCVSDVEPPAIAATTAPVYEFTSRLCDGTGLTVGRLITENVSCLHDYSLNVRQVRTAEAAQLIVLSGAGLEEFMEDLLQDKAVIDASEGIELLECTEAHDHEHDHHHDHEADSHIWLSPDNARQMSINICAGLSAAYPEYAGLFEANLSLLLSEIDALKAYGEVQLSGLSNRELITFHDGFAYLAESFDLEILKAIEEESGSEASASELKELILLVREHRIPAIFTEVNGSSSAASVITRETGIGAYPLDMAMSEANWFEAMYHNIDTLKEALE